MIPFMSNITVNFRMLLSACDSCGPRHCALIPLYHCLHTPGGPLKVTVINLLVNL